MKRAVRILGLSLLLASGACKNGLWSNGSGGSSESAEPAPAAAPVDASAALTDPTPAAGGSTANDPTTPEAFQAQLQGSWNQTCAQAAGSASYMTSKLKVDGPQAVLNETEFRDAKCLTVTTPLQTTPLTYVVSGPSTLLPGGFNVDVTLGPGEVVYVVWQIKGGTFYPADTSDPQFDGSTPDKRTRAIDFERPYARL